MQYFADETIQWLLLTTIQASLIVGLIIVARILFENRLTPGWSYFLWMLLIIRLVLPNPVSIELPGFLNSFHPLNLSQDYSFDTAVSARSLEHIPSEPNLTQLGSNIQISTSRNPFTQSLVLIWFLGMTLTAYRFARKYLLTLKHVNQCSYINDPRLLHSLKKLSHKHCLKRKINLKLSRSLNSPASFGLIHPVILLPLKTIELNPTKIEMILEHELIHHKRLDIVVDTFMLIAKSIHWFNPIVWHAHTKMRADCELSCDHSVTRHLSQQLKQDYGELLIMYATRSTPTRATYSITSMSAQRAQLSKRIKSLAIAADTSWYKTIQIFLIAIVVLLLGLTSPAYSAFKTQNILFDYSTSQGISTFSSQRSNPGIVDYSQQEKVISGLLTRPTAKGKFPAIILVHGCEGFDARHKIWAKQLNDSGFVTLRIQRRNLKTPYCEKPIAEINTLTASQVMDAYAALDYLSTIEFVDPEKISVMSWESWGAIGAAATHGVGQVYLNKFKSAIAMYPDCTATYNGEFSSPLLIIVGDSDQWAQAQDCISIENFARQARNQNVHVKVYANTYHGFDNQKFTQATFLPYAKNLGKLSNPGATAKYNRTAHLDAQNQISRFLNNNYSTQ